MNEHCFRRYIKLLLLVLIPILFLNCSKKKESPFSAKSSELDSVRIWIAESKEKDVNVDGKLKLLQKAFNSAKTASTDSLECKYLTEISFSLTFLKDSLLFRQVNGEGLQLAKSIKDSMCLSSLHWDAGDFFKKNAVQDSAYYHYVEAEKIFTKLNDNFSSGSLLYLMARVQNNIGDYTGSEITTIKAIEKLKPLNKYRQLASCYDNLGDVTKLLNESDRSLEYYEQSLAYIKKADLGPLREQTYKNNIGLVYQQMGQYTKAASYFSEVSKYDSLRYQNPRLYARALNNLGYSNLKANKTEQLPSLFKQAFKIQDSINDIAGKASSTYKVAEYLLLKKDTANALAHLKRSRKYAIEASDNKTLLATLRIFPKVDPKNSPSYTQAYINLNDSLQSQERQLRDKFTRIRFETDEFIAENQLLARQRQLWTGIAGAILLLSIATFVIVSQRIKNQKLRFQKEQQESNQEIMNLLLTQGTKLEEGKQIEQKRISEELHDGVQGRLQGARMMLLGLNKKQDEHSVNERARAIVMLKDIQEEVRSISHELSHSAYQKIHNFILTLEDLKTTIAKSAEIEINFKHAQQLDWDALNNDIKINLYRIIQESLQNAVKHSQCDTIELNLEADAQYVKVSIKDNGIGFVVKKGKKGIGTRNINSRMKKLGGTWDISSELGKGTTVTLVIPILEKNDSKENKMKTINLQKA